jgi:hypothetical protein
MLSRISSIESDFSYVTTPGASPLAAAVFNPLDLEDYMEDYSARSAGQAPGFILGAHAARAQPARITRMSRALLDDSDEDAGCGDDAPPPFTPSAEQEQQATGVGADESMQSGSKEARETRETELEPNAPPSSS